MTASLTGKLISHHTLSLWIKRIINMMDGLISQNLLSSPPRSRTLGHFFVSFSLSFPAVSLSVCLSPSLSFLCCHPADKHDISQWSGSPKPRNAHVTGQQRRSRGIDPVPQASQSDWPKPIWLIGAQRNDLRPGEHVHTCSSGSCSRTDRWVLLCAAPRTGGQRVEEGKLWHPNSLKVTLLLQRWWESKMMSGRNYWQCLIEPKLADIVLKRKKRQRSLGFWWWYRIAKWWCEHDIWYM